MVTYHQLWDRSAGRYALAKWQKSPPSKTRISLGSSSPRERLVYLHGVHRGFGDCQGFKGLALRRPLSLKLVKPRQRAPLVFPRLVGKLARDGVDVSDDADGHASVTPDLVGGRVDLNDPGIRGDGGRHRVSHDDVLFPSQHQYHVGPAQQTRRTVEAGVEEPEGLRVIVWDKPSCIALRHERELRGLN